MKKGTLLFALCDQRLACKSGLFRALDLRDTPLMHDDLHGSKSQRGHFLPDDVQPGLDFSFCGLLRHVRERVRFEMMKPDAPCSAIRMITNIH